jgi:hypothetical protein
LNIKNNNILERRRTWIFNETNVKEHMEKNQFVREVRAKLMQKKFKKGSLK